MSDIETRDAPENWVRKLDQLAASRGWMAPLYHPIRTDPAHWTVLAVVRNEEHCLMEGLSTTPDEAAQKTARVLYERLADAPPIERGIPPAPAVTAIVMAHRSATCGHGQLTPLSSCSEMRYFLCDEMGPVMPPREPPMVVWMQIGHSARGAFSTMPMAQRALLGILLLVRQGHRAIALYRDVEDVLPINVALNAVGLRFAPTDDRAMAAVLRVPEYAVFESRQTFLAE